MAANDTDAIIGGAYGPGNIPSELLKYDKDRAGGLLYIKRGTTKLMHMINTMFGKRQVSSFEPKWFDIGEMDSIFDVTVNQTDTDAGFVQFELTNAQALQLQPGDLLSVAGMFLEDGREGGVAGVYSRIQNSKAVMEEQILVTDMPYPDSSRTGYANVKVRRAYANSKTSGRLMAPPTRQSDGLMQAGDQLMHLGNAQWTGSDAPRGFSKNIVLDSNPLQIMRFAFEQQNETDLEKTFLNETQMSINQKLALNKMAYTMEYRALFNRPVKEQQDGSWRYAMGGLFDFIPASNYLDYSNKGAVASMDWMSFQKNVMAPLFELGGSAEKTAFCSIDTYTNLAMLLWNKVSIQINAAWSQRFGFEIYKIAGGGGELNLVPSWVYGRNKFRASQMLVLDFGGPYFKVDVMEDLHINKGKGGTGLQLPGQEITKWEYKCIMGLQRRASQYHAVVTGLPVL